MEGDHILFMREDNVERAWEVMMPAIENPPEPSGNVRSGGGRHCSQLRLRATRAEDARQSIRAKRGLLEATVRIIGEGNDEGEFQFSDPECVPYTHLELRVGAKRRFVAVYRLIRGAPLLVQGDARPG
jgi:hypothetical protein